MKTMVIIRFGTPKLLSFEPHIFARFDPNQVGIAGSLGQIGIIGIIKTDASPQEIVQAFDEAAEMTNNKLPVLVGEVGEIGMNLEAFGFAKFLEEFNKRCTAAGIEEYCAPETEEPNQVCNLSLDDLLDLANAKGGISKLSPEESARLKELSK